MALYHRLVINTINSHSFCRSSGGWKLKVKITTKIFSSMMPLLLWILPFPSLHTGSHFRLSLWIFCFLKWKQSHWVKIYLKWLLLLQRPCFKYSHIMRYWAMALNVECKQFIYTRYSHIPDLVDILQGALFPFINKDYWHSEWPLPWFSKVVCPQFLLCPLEKLDDFRSGLISPQAPHFG